VSVHLIEGVQIRAILTGCPAVKIDHMSNESLAQNPALESFSLQTGIRYQYKMSAQDSIEKGFAQLGFKVLEALKWHGSEIDCCIVLTQTNEASIPSFANRLHDELNFAHDCACFDINSGCSGFPYGMATITSLLASSTKNISRALLFIGDYSNQLIDPEDAATKFLFSDGLAVAAVEVEHGKTNQSFFKLESDGRGRRAIFSEKKDAVVQMRLNGLDVFQYSLSTVPNHVHSFIAEFNLKPDLFVLHQANLLINNALKRQLGQYNAEFLDSIETFGNTGSASIPITLVVQKEQVLGKSIYLCGFGVGFSVASAFINLPSNCILQSIVLDHV
jgi:3-oxoacyl-[acyl-carrier-protein] synthase-3